jgi:hypothetical protein
MFLAVCSHYHYFEVLISPRPVWNRNFEWGVTGAMTRAVDQTISEYMSVWLFRRRTFLRRDIRLLDQGTNIDLTNPA